MEGGVGGEFLATDVRALLSMLLMVEIPPESLAACPDERVFIPLKLSGEIGLD